MTVRRALLVVAFLLTLGTVAFAASTAGWSGPTRPRNLNAPSSRPDQAPGFWLPFYDAGTGDFIWRELGAVVVPLVPTPTPTFTAAPSATPSVTPSLTPTPTTQATMTPEGAFAVVQSGVLQPDRSCIATLLGGKTCSAGSGPTDNFRRFRGVETSPTAVADGDLVYSLQGNGWDGDSYERTAQMQMRVDGTVSNGVVPMRFDFFTSITNAGALTIALSLRSNGDVRLPLVLSCGNLSTDAQGDITCLATPTPYPTPTVVLTATVTPVVCRTVGTAVGFLGGLFKANPDECLGTPQPTPTATATIPPATPTYTIPFATPTAQLTAVAAPTSCPTVASAIGFLGGLFKANPPECIATPLPTPTATATVPPATATYTIPFATPTPQLTAAAAPIACRTVNTAVGVLGGLYADNPAACVATPAPTATATATIPPATPTYTIPFATPTLAGGTPTVTSTPCGIRYNGICVGAAVAEFNIPTVLPTIYATSYATAQPTATPVVDVWGGFRRRVVANGGFQRGSDVQYSYYTSERALPDIPDLESVDVTLAPVTLLAGSNYYAQKNYAFTSTATGGSTDAIFLNYNVTVSNAGGANAGFLRSTIFDFKLNYDDTPGLANDAVYPFVVQGVTVLGGTLSFFPSFVIEPWDSSGSGGTVTNYTFLCAGCLRTGLPTGTWGLYVTDDVVGGSLTNAIAGVLNVGTEGAPRGTRMFDVRGLAGMNALHISTTPTAFPTPTQAAGTATATASLTPTATPASTFTPGGATATLVPVATPTPLGWDRDQPLGTCVPVTSGFLNNAISYQGFMGGQILGSGTTDAGHGSSSRLPFLIGGFECNISGDERFGRGFQIGVEIASEQACLNASTSDGSKITCPWMRLGGSCRLSGNTDFRNASCKQGYPGVTYDATFIYVAPDWNVRVVMEQLGSVTTHYQCSWLVCVRGRYR